MCLIAHKPVDAVFPERLAPSTFSRNSDGFGAMYSEGNGRVVVSKSLPKNANDIASVIKEFQTVDASFHWRMRTHGWTDMENVHPYQILSFDGDGLDMYIMHNGVLGCVNEVDPSKSDTWHFVEGFLKPLCQHNPDIILDDAFQKTLGKMIGNNRFCIYRGDIEEPVIINRTQGVEGKTYGECWLSNTYAFNDPEDKTWSNYSSIWNRGNYYEDYSEDLNTRIESNAATDTSRASLYTSNFTLMDLTQMSQEDLQDFCFEFPDEAAEILWELING